MSVTDVTADWRDSQLLPPFDRIEESDFRPALDMALDRTRQSIARIAECPEPPTFNNLIDELELAFDMLDRVADIFFNLARTDSTPGIRDLEFAINTDLARLDTEIASNAVLFQRLDSLWGRRHRLGLTTEQQLVLKHHYRKAINAGAKLSSDRQERFAAITERLAVLNTQFGQNILADESSWHMPLSAAAVASLPQFLRSASAEAASQRDIDGHIITFDRSLIEPFLQFCEDRSLRKQAYLAWSARGANAGETDNSEIVAEILALRHELAALLGHHSYADYKLQDEMAKSPNAARQLLSTIWEPARQAAESDRAEFQAALESDGYTDSLEPWDWRFYAERRRQTKHDLDESEIKRYFRLDQLMSALFHVADRLFGLQFKEVDVPAYHPDCTVWQVYRADDPIAVFVADHFSRPSKLSGAWCSTFADQSKYRQEVRPVVVNVCNFIKPAAGKPCHLSYDDARTLFHEFGHALHTILSDVTYPSVSGISVPRDFAELPSQLLENWLDIPEILNRFAVDFETGDALPEQLRSRMRAARNINQPFSTVEYLASAFVDLDFHAGPPPSDPIARQQEILADLEMPHAIGMRHATPHFLHVFSDDGYSACYYSYIWADVLAADAYDAFIEANDPFAPEVARSLEKEILSVGGSREPEDSYLQFRGRLPKPESLLRKRGFLRGI